MAGSSASEVRYAGRAPHAARGGGGTAEAGGHDPIGKWCTRLQQSVFTELVSEEKGSSAEACNSYKGPRSLEGMLCVGFGAFLLLFQRHHEVLPLRVGASPFLSWPLPPRRRERGRPQLCGGRLPRMVPPRRGETRVSLRRQGDPASFPLLGNGEVWRANLVYRSLDSDLPHAAAGDQQAAIALDPPLGRCD